MEHRAWSTEQEHGACSTKYGARSREHWLTIFLNEINKTVCLVYQILFQFSTKVSKFSSIESHWNRPKHCQFSRFFGSGRCWNLIRMHLHVANSSQETFLQTVEHLHLVSIQRIYPRNSFSGGLAINASNLWIRSSFHMYFSYNLAVVETGTVMS